MECVESLTFSSSGELLASGSWDKTAVVWELSDGRKLAELYHSGWVESVDFSPDEKYLASSAGYIATVREFSNRKKIVEFHHGSWVKSVAFSPDGRYLATCSEDKTAVVWEIANERKIKVFLHDRWIESVDFSPSGGHLVTGSNDGAAIVWKIAGGRKIAKFQHHGAVYSVAFSPDGRYIVIGGTDMHHVTEWKKSKITRTEYHEGTICDISWFKRIFAYHYRVGGMCSPFAELPGGYTWSMALSRRGFLALGYTDGRIEVIREGKVI